MEPFKNLLHAGVAQRIGSQLQQVDPGFDRPRFEALATAGLEALELKARAMQMADALEATLPGDFATACDQLEATLAPPWADERLGSDAAGPDASRGLEGWALWPVGEFIARRGTQDIDRALQAGVAAYLAKPVSIAALLAHIDALLEARGDASAVKAAR